MGVRSDRLGVALARRTVDPVDRTLRRLPLDGVGRAGFEAGVSIARAVRWLDRRTDERIDASRAGRGLLAAAPDSLGRLTARLPRGVVLVSATNGKTTTTGLLAGILTAAEWRVATSVSGTNMAPGLVAELVASSRLGGRTAAEIGVFEVDELWLDRVLPQVAPRVLVLGGLLRDQLDRTGEIDRVAAHWGELVAGLPSTTTLAVTADDPRVHQATAGHPNVVTFGIDDEAGDHPSHPPASADLADCRWCDSPLTYASRHIGHLGRWRCPVCGDRSPEPDVVAGEVQDDGLAGARFTLSTPRGSASVAMRLPGRFNVANAAAAAAAAHALGVPVETTAAALATTAGSFGRAETIDVGGRPVTLLLAKNPTGLDEVLRLLAGERPLHVLFLLNDDVLDGRDVSWIWDADVEGLAPHLASVTCGGTRAAEAALRCDYAGVDPTVIDVVDGPSAGVALDRALGRSATRLFALCNYTAMLDLRETLAERGHVGRYWW